MRRRLAATLVLAVAIAAAFALTRSGAGTPRTPYAPRAVRVARATVLTSGSPARASAGTRRVRHYEYVFPDRELDVFDIDHGHRLVQRVRIPGAHGIRGIVAYPPTHTLWITYGGDGGSTGTGSMLRYDLLTNRVVWQKSYPTGVDSPAIGRDGRTIYLPTGERASGRTWDVVDAATRRVRNTIEAGTSPHNTVVSLDGRRVYLGPRSENELYVASTVTGRIVQRIGPLKSGVRPFTINGRQTLAYTIATGFLGFQVSSIRTGKVLYTETFKGFNWDPSTFAPSTPSHGIALSPSERRLYVLDVPSSTLHVFDVSRVPASPPRAVADVRLTKPMTGTESPCGGPDCARDGWVQTSSDGRFVYVGDSGDVVDGRTLRVVRFVPALYNSRYSLEIDWRDGRPVATGSRTSIGHVTGSG